MSFMVKRLAHPLYHKITASPAVRKRCARALWGGLYRDWCAANPCPEFSERNALYEHVVATEGLAGRPGDRGTEGPIDYIEFGVYKGETLLWWAGRNSHPESSFTGFDCFEGLPEAWEDCATGAFDTGGAVPQTSDPRCHFVKGYFQDTVLDWVVGHAFRHRRVVHLDADLYSSTLLALVTLSPRLGPGDILIFDEFDSYDHEFRAFHEASLVYPRSYRVLGRTRGWRQVALRIEPGTT